jgi:hypothetical protein
MSTGTRESPRLLHVIPGRARIHLPAWPEHARGRIESELQRAPGVRNARANHRTGNVLIHFDPAATNETNLLAVSSAIGQSVNEASACPSGPRPTASSKALALAQGVAVAGEMVGLLHGRRPVANEGTHAPLWGLAKFFFQISEVFTSAFGLEELGAMFSGAGALFRIADVLVLLAV